MTKHMHHHTGRFSEGMERVPPAAASRQIGTFADGIAMTAIPRVGTFADRLALHPEAPPARRLGSFGDTQPPARTTRRWLGFGRTTPQPA